MRLLRYLTIMLVFVGAASITLAQQWLPEIDGEIVATGFNRPQGIVVDEDGAVWVIDSGLGDGTMTPMSYGMTARVVKITRDGAQTEIALLPSFVVGEAEILGGARLAFVDGVLYATVGGWRDDLPGERPPLMGSLVRIADGTVTEVADLWAYEAANNPDGKALNSRPAGLAGAPDGWLWVVDTGGSSVLRVHPQTGAVETVTAFTGGLFSTAPTGIAFQTNGQAYVSLLYDNERPAFNIFALSDAGKRSDYRMTQLNLIDLRPGPDGILYTIQSDASQPLDNGMILRVIPDDPLEILASSLPSPASLAFDSGGNAYLTVHSLGEPGSGAVMRFAALTAGRGSYWMPPAPSSSGCECG